MRLSHLALLLVMIPVTTVSGSVDDAGAELVVAAWMDGVERVGQLLDAGAPVDARNAAGATALMIASGRGDVAIVSLLLERGADPNRRDVLGRTALFVPAMLGISRVVELLLAAGADPNLASNDADVLPNTPLHLAAANGRRRVVELLLEAGAQACATDASGATPLQLAQRHDAGRSTRSLLQRYGGECAVIGGR
jgi:ankyrin repeat protein